MPTQHTVTLYTFEELPNAKAKERARAWWRAASSGDSWYENVYEDAAQAGLKITAFDTYRGDSCDIEFVDSAFATCVAIRKEHGELTDTYKAAIAYEQAVCALPDAHGNLEEENRVAEGLAAIETEFLKALSRAYLKMLRDELETIQSDAYIDECLTGNDYTFLENGKRFEP